jgi:hypothetical protein
MFLILLHVSQCCLERLRAAKAPGGEDVRAKARHGPARIGSVRDRNARHHSNGSEGGQVYQRSAEVCTSGNI